MDTNKYYVRAYAPITFFLNGCRLKVERGGLYGPVSYEQIQQVRRTANSSDYQVIEDKGKAVEVKEAVAVEATIRTEIKVSEPYVEDNDVIEQLLRPVKVSLTPTIPTVDQSQLPSVIPVGDESVSLEDYSKTPVVIPETPRLLQDKVNKNVNAAKSLEQERKAKASRAKKAETSDDVEAETVTE